MSSFEDVGSDGDELLDWLSDLPDRYDLGFEEEPIGTGAPAEAADPGGLGSGEAVPVPGVKKHLRKAGDHTGQPPLDPFAAGPSLDTAPSSADPSLDTAAHDTLAPDLVVAEAPPSSVETAALTGLDWGPMDHDAVPGSGGMRGRTLEPLAYQEPLAFEENPPNRFRRRDIMAGAAVLLIVVVGVGVGIVLSGGGKHPKPGTVAIGTPTSTLFTPTTLDLNTTLPSSDTTVPDTTPTTTPGAPALTPTATTVPTSHPAPKPTTTTPRTTCNRPRAAHNVLFRVEGDVTTITTASTTTTTMPTTTMPTTTLPPTTPPPTTAPATTTPGCP